MRIVLATLVLLMCATPSAAQDAAAAGGRIRGQIVEARTAAPLPAVLVEIEGTRERVLTDAAGEFVLELPLGRHTLMVSVVGFGLVRRDVVITAGETLEITIPVHEGASTYVEDVSVTAGSYRDAQPDAVTQSLLTSRELLALRGVIADDPFRAVQVLPGVATGDDFRAEFAVRGLGPRHVGLAIDGVDSPLLFHTVRGVDDTGSLALINSDLLEEATLLSGVHAQRLGSHLGARLDFRTRDGSRDRIRGRTLVSGSATTAVVEGPFGNGEHGSWLVAGRKSYLDWLLRRVDTSIDGTFGFGDGQLKLLLQPAPAHQLRLSFIGGRSELDEDDGIGINSFDRGRNQTVIGSVHWRFTPSPRYAITQQLYVVKGDYVNRVTDGRPREQGSDRDVTWRGTAEWAPHDGHLVDAGLQVQSLRAHRTDRRYTQTSTLVLFDVTFGHTPLAGWTAYRWTPLAGFSVSPGVRVERWDLAEGTTAAPWVTVDWAFAHDTRLRGGVGVQRQGPSPDHVLRAGEMLRPERARLADVSLERRFRDAWRISGAAYHRRDANLLDLRNAEPRMVDGRISVPVGAVTIANALTGTARGVEFVVERRAAAGASGWLSYAWADARYRDTITGETFAADWDQRHTVNANLAWRWSERSSLSVRYRYGSNFPIRAYAEPIDDTRYRLGSTRNATRLPAYSRLDARVDRAFTYGRRRLTLFAEVVNALNQTNYRAQSAGVDPRTGEIFGLREKLFPLLPSAGVLFEF